MLKPVRQQLQQALDRLSSPIRAGDAPGIEQR